MDVYTTSFTYPRRARNIHSPPSSLDFPPQQDPTLSADAEAVQKLALMVMSLHGCHVSYQPVDQGRAWNFHITGAYQQVMISRGLILKECPIQASFHSRDEEKEGQSTSSLTYRIPLCSTAQQSK